MRMLMLAVVLVLGAAFVPPCYAEAAKALTNQDVVQMVKAGLPESTILLSIKSAPVEFQTAPTDLIALKKAGVSQAVLDAMLTRNSEAAATSVAPQVPDSTAGYSVGGGFVAIDGDRRVALQTSTEDAYKTRKKFWHVEYVGIFSGNKAGIRLKSRTPTFELPFPPGPDAEEAVRLMKMDVRGATREVGMRVLTYDTMLRRVPTVTDGLVEITLTAAPGAESSASVLTPKAPLEPGEYAIIRSNTDVYDFGVD